MFKTIAKTSLMTGAGILLLSACSFSFNASVTVSPDNIEETIETSLTEQVETDLTPDVDCGDEQIELTEGNSFTCTLTAEEDNSTVFDVEVVLTQVDGNEYSVDYQVADTPN